LGLITSSKQLLTGDDWCVTFAIEGGGTKTVYVEPEVNEKRAVWAAICTLRALQLKGVDYKARRRYQIDPHFNRPEWKDLARSRGDRARLDEPA
tara:strand:+ start:395 stop:676 length:282 start_codon:yes stop_codon:yes gene_type:complete